MSERPHFDPDQSWSALEKRMASEKDPRRLQLLTQVRDHMRTEITGQLEPLMATLVDEPRYHFRGLGPDVAPKGREAVRSFYEGMVAGGGHRFMFDIERIVVDDDAVVTEGFMRTLTTGEALMASGVTEVEGEAVDAEARYVASNRILTVWPADADGRLIGEDIWFGGAPGTDLARL